MSYNNEPIFADWCEEIYKEVTSSRGRNEGGCLIDLNLGSQLPRGRGRELATYRHRSYSNIQTPKLQPISMRSWQDPEAANSRMRRKREQRQSRRRGLEGTPQWCAEREEADSYLVCSLIRSLANKNSALFADARRWAPLRPRLCPISLALSLSLSIVNTLLLSVSIARALSLSLSLCLSLSLSWSLPRLRGFSFAFSTSKRDKPRALRLPFAPPGGWAGIMRMCVRILSAFVFLYQLLHYGGLCLCGFVSVRSYTHFSAPASPPPQGVGLMVWSISYGVATISRLSENIGLFCKRAL